MDWLLPYYCAAVLSASRILMTSWAPAPREALRNGAGGRCEVRRGVQPQAGGGQLWEPALNDG